MGFGGKKGKTEGLPPLAPQEHCTVHPDDIDCVPREQRDCGSSAESNSKGIPYKNPFRLFYRFLSI